MDKLTKRVVVVLQADRAWAVIRMRSYVWLSYECWIIVNCASTPIFCLRCRCCGCTIQDYESVRY
ncbi:hypothetical protein O9992_12250 [Vibrio lentus]|nr:hypothetical protein [Vibrio lentus]